MNIRASIAAKGANDSVTDDPFYLIIRFHLLLYHNGAGIVLASASKSRGGWGVGAVGRLGEGGAGPPTRQHNICVQKRELSVKRPPAPHPPLNSRQHSALIWFALQSSKSKQCTEIRGDDHMPVSRGYMRAQYPD